MTIPSQNEGVGWGDLEFIFNSVTSQHISQLALISSFVKTLPTYSVLGHTYYI